MNIKRIYKVNEIYYLGTMGCMFSLEKNFQPLTNFVNKKVKLLVNKKYIEVKIKGIESASGKGGHKLNLHLTSLNDDEDELTIFLNLDKQKLFQEIAEDVFLEIEFFDKEEIQKILEYEKRNK